MKDILEIFLFNKKIFLKHNSINLSQHVYHKHPFHTYNIFLLLFFYKTVMLCFLFLDFYHLTFLIYWWFIISNVMLYFLSNNDFVHIFSDSVICFILSSIYSLHNYFPNSSEKVFMWYWFSWNISVNLKCVYYYNS